MTCSGIDELPSFPGASTISSSSRFVVEGVFRESGVVHSFMLVDPVSFVFESHVLYSRGQTKRDKLVLQEWGFCGWVGKPPKENKLLISKDAQPWIIILVLSSNLCLGLSSGLFPSVVPTTTPYARLLSLICATCLALLNILHFIARIIFGEDP